MKRDETIAAIEGRLRFPADKGRNDILRSDGIWDFVEGTGVKGAAVEPETSQYQGKYEALSSAASYNVGYQQRKQRRTLKEVAILRGLLANHVGAECVLDMPCGGGRMSPVIAEFAQSIIEMDLALGQLLYGREHSEVSIPRVWVRASGFQIPLNDRSVDGAVCIRLAHHLYAVEEKEQLLSELLRVSRAFVVISFVDSRSPKYAMRRLRCRLCRRPLRSTAITPEALGVLAGRHGGRLIASPAIGILQAHRYALILKS